MPESNAQSLKRQVRDYWNVQSCDTQVSKSEKFSRDYFEEIEAFRYFDQPFIHAFAQFSRYFGKRVLEVGFGAGTDFIQWLRAGAKASGIDLTEEAQANLRHRIATYGLPLPETVEVGDAENLRFPSDSFDLGYSFGVLHHTPDTMKAIGELVRVVRPGGEVKIMLYNRHSIWSVNLWVKKALLRGRPWRSLGHVLWHHNESIGTKGYTRSELARMLSEFPLTRVHVRTEMTAGDYLSASAIPPLNWAYRLCLLVAGVQEAWHPSDYVPRITDEQKSRVLECHRDPNRVVFTGNRFGFFHCIHAWKK